MEAAPPHRIHLDVRLLAQRGSGRRPLVVRVFRSEVPCCGFSNKISYRVKKLLYSCHFLDAQQTDYFPVLRSQKMIKIITSIALAFFVSACGAGGGAGGSGISNSSLQIPSQVSVVTAN